METNNKIPNTRINKFYSEQDFQMEVDMASELINEDLNFTVILYRIDMENSTKDDVYGESKVNEIRYLSPVEIKVILNLLPSENKTYDLSSGKLRHQEYNNLEFSILNRQLEEKKVDISYGDIIGYSDRENNLKYFEVFDDGKINSDNKHTQFGYKSFYRSIKCVTLDPNQFNNI